MPGKKTILADHNDIGKLGEEFAVKFLEEQGFKVFDRNYKVEKAEVDIVAYWEDPERPGISAELHFIEVKTLSDTSHRNPEEAVDQGKLENMAKVAQFYLVERQFVTLPVVFDVIAVSLDDPENPRIDHFEDVYRPGMKI